MTWRITWAKELYICPIDQLKVYGSYFCSFFSPGLKKISWHPLFLIHPVQLCWCTSTPLLFFRHGGLIYNITYVILRPCFVPHSFFIISFKRTCCSAVLMHFCHSPFSAYMSNAPMTSTLARASASPLVRWNSLYLSSTYCSNLCLRIK